MTITNANVPRPPIPQSQLNANVEAQAKAAYGRKVPVEIDDSIIAMPLSMPGEEIVLKDKAMQPRWVNYAVGDKQSSLRFSQMKAAGFIVCKPEDVEKGLENVEVLNDGRVMQGDCILMKISKARYDGAKKWNWERAQRRRGKNLANEARQSVAADIRNSGAPASQLRKISTFVPSDVDLGALVGTDTDTKK